MGGYAMTSVVGLVLVAMTGLTITNQHRNHQKTVATGKSLESSGQQHHSLRDDAMPGNAKELELALAREDDALWASYERFQQQQRQHPRNVRLQKERRTGHAAAASVDPMMLNSVYSLNTKSELAAGIEDGAEFVVHQRANGDDPSGTPPAIIPAVTTSSTARATTTTTGGDEIESTTSTTTTDGPEKEATVAVQDEQRPFDFYDPSLTALQKREYVKKVVYFLSLFLSPLCFSRTH